MTDKEQAGNQGNHWSRFYSTNDAAPAAGTLLFALSRFSQSDHQAGNLAVDIGCGHGRDAVELLSRGWRVLAIDREPEALKRLLSRPLDPYFGRLDLRLASFETMDLPPALLLNASLSLPFCPKRNFAHLWTKIRQALLPGGRFCGQFFGERDGWFGKEHLSHHSQSEIEHLLNGWEVELLQHEEWDAPSVNGPEKHWHVVNVVAARR